MGVAMVKKVRSEPSLNERWNPIGWTKAGVVCKWVKFTLAESVKIIIGQATQAPKLGLKEELPVKTCFKLRRERELRK